MDLNDAKQKLREEGFASVYVQEDRPRTFYPEHVHPVKTAHVILDGAMSITMEGKTHVLKSGYRFDVPANIAHYAKIGPHGCRYLIGE